MVTSLNKSSAAVSLKAELFAQIKLVSSESNIEPQQPITSSNISSQAPGHSKPLNNSAQAQRSRRNAYKILHFRKACAYDEIMDTIFSPEFEYIDLSVWIQSLKDKHVK